MRKGIWEQVRVQVRGLGGMLAGLAFAQFALEWPSWLLTTRVHSEISPWAVPAVSILNITSGDIGTLRNPWETLALFMVFRIMNRNFRKRASWDNILAFLLVMFLFLFLFLPPPPLPSPFPPFPPFPGSLCILKHHSGRCRIEVLLV